MRTLWIALTIVLLLVAAALGLFFWLVVGPQPGGHLTYLKENGLLLGYDLGLIPASSLTTPLQQRLYRNTCTRKCHGHDLIAQTPRTALEWEQIVTRMRTVSRGGQPAGFSERQAAVIVTWLQRNYLSTLPTLLPEPVMRYLKRHLWRMDFGGSDLYLDVIYLPGSLRHLIPYLVLTREIPPDEGPLFVVYLNTHSGVIPPWNLATMAFLSDPSGQRQKAVRWEQRYEDGQLHHRQGILTFPQPSEPFGNGELTITFRLPGLRERSFQWTLPIPPDGESGNDLRDPATRDPRMAAAPLVDAAAGSAPGLRR